MPGKKRLAGALAVTAAAVAISGCGSSDPKTIPPESAAALESALTAVETAINDRNCGEAEARAHDFVLAVNELPDTVGAEDKDALRNAGVNLETLAADPNQCKEPVDTGPSGDTGVEPTTTTTAPTIVPTTEPTTTSTSTTTTSAPPSDTGGGPPSDTGGGPPTDTGGGPPSDTGGGGDTGGGSGGTGGTGSGGTGGGG